MKMLSTVMSSQSSASLRENLLGSSCLFVVFGVVLVMRKCIRSVKGDTTKEWWMLVLNQSLFVTFLFVYTLMSNDLSDVLVTHRGFCMKFIYLILHSAHSTYLPLKFHAVVVCMQTAAIWLLFHWMVGFLPPIVYALAFTFPAAEAYFYICTREKSWHTFCLVEREKNARLISESLREALRGVLDVTFDASCECDERGIILSSSRHLQQLIGSSTSDLVGVGLVQLASKPAEALRVETFLRQVSAQKVGAAAHFVPSPALLETVLRCYGSQGDRKRDELKVKLCCVPLPEGCAVQHPAPGGNGQRIFVGLQTVSGSDVEILNSNSCSSDQELLQESVVCLTSLPSAGAPTSEFLMLGANNCHNSRLADAPILVTPPECPLIPEDFLAVEPLANSHCLDWESSIADLCTVHELDTRSVGSLSFSAATQATQCELCGDRRNGTSAIGSLRQGFRRRVDAAESSTQTEVIPATPLRRPPALPPRRGHDSRPEVIPTPFADDTRNQLAPRTSLEGGREGVGKRKTENEKRKTENTYFVKSSASRFPNSRGWIRIKKLALTNRFS